MAQIHGPEIKSHMLFWLSQQAPSLSNFKPNHVPFEKQFSMSLSFLHISFCSGASSLGCVYRDQAWELETVSPSRAKEQVCILANIIKTTPPSGDNGRQVFAHYKRHSFPALGSPKPLLCLAAYVAWRQHFVLCVTLWELGLQYKNYNTLATAGVGNNQLSFISDPGI